MSKNKCTACGKDYSIGVKDKVLRRSVTSLAKQFPSLGSLAKETEKYCNECWKLVMLPAAEGLRATMTHTPQTVHPLGEEYVVTLSFTRDGNTATERADLLDPSVSGLFTTKRYLREGWILIDVDDPYSENPTNAATVIASSSAPRKTKKKQVRFVQFLCKELQKQQ